MSRRDKKKEIKSELEKERKGNHERFFECETCFHNKIMNE